MAFNTSGSKDGSVKVFVSERRVFETIDIDPPKTRCPSACEASRATPSTNPFPVPAAAISTLTPSPRPRRSRTRAACWPVIVVRAEIAASNRRRRCNSDASAKPLRSSIDGVLFAVEEVPGLSTAPAVSGTRSGLRIVCALRSRSSDSGDLRGLRPRSGDFAGRRGLDRDAAVVGPPDWAS